MLYDPTQTTSWAALKSGALKMVEAVGRVFPGLTPGDVTLDPVGTYLAAGASTAFLTEDTYGSPLPVDVHPDLAELLQWQVAWASTGMPVFAPTHSLQAQLLLTECESVPMREVTPPFGAFAVTLPDDTFRIEVGNRLDPVRAIVFMRQRVPVHRADAEALATLLSPVAEGVNVPQGGVHRVLQAARHRLLTTPMQDRWMLRLVGSTGVGVFYGGACEDAPVGAWLKENPRGPGVDIGLGMTPLDRQSLRTAWRLLVNLLLYIDHERTEGRVSLARTKPARADKPSPHTIVLGQTVKLPAPLREAAVAYVQRGENAARWKVAVRTFVRGHYKLQPHGPRGELRKRLRVEPYWRGPDTGTVVPRRFAVDRVR